MLLTHRAAHGHDELVSPDFRAAMINHKRDVIRHIRRVKNSARFPDIHGNESEGISEKKGPVLERVYAPARAGIPLLNN